MSHLFNAFSKVKLINNVRVSISENGNKKDMQTVTQVIARWEALP